MIHRATRAYDFGLEIFGMDVRFHVPRETGNLGAFSRSASG
jgi:hypothetical protein